jgi:replicative DNA helicase
MKTDTLQPPFSLDAEQAVLGGLMLDERAYTRVADFLSESDFYREDHRMIFRAISELQSQGKPYDTVTLSEWFEANGAGDLMDGNYIYKLANTTPSAANVSAYGEIVRERSRLRQIIAERARRAGR